MSSPDPSQFSTAEWEHLVSDGLAYLRRLAGARDHVDHAQFNEWVCDDAFDLETAEGRALMSALLTEISRRSVATDSAMLSALVHAKGERLDVGDEFYTLATQLGRFRPAADPVVRRMYLGTEVENAYAQCGAATGMRMPATWSADDPTRPVQLPRAVTAWAGAAPEVLQDVASSYDATVTYDELAERLFAVTGLHTRTLPTHWVGRILGPVQRATLSAGRPPLSALVVKPTGGVGRGYINAGHPHGFDSEYERQYAAAADRLTCYRAFADDVPDDARPTLTAAYLERHGEPPRPTSPGGAGGATRGGRAAHTGGTTRAGRTARTGAGSAAPRRSTSSSGAAGGTSRAKSGDGRSVAAEAPPKVCPRCFMVLPLSGQCDTCG